MKKSLLAAAILASVSGAASAATSVTLYGIVDVGYGRSNWTATDGGAYSVNGTAVAGDSINVSGGAVVQPGVASSTLFLTNGALPTSTKTNSGLQQIDGHRDQSRVGVRGQEDLGNGLSAIFQAEFQFDATQGNLGNSTTTALDQSFVGLKGSFGQVTVGRRATITDDLFGYNSIADEIDGSAVAPRARYNNDLAYRGSFGGLTIGADLATKEVTLTNPTGTTQYQVAAKYAFGKASITGSYSHDDQSSHLYNLGVDYDFGMAKVFARAGMGKTSSDNMIGLTTQNYSKKSFGWAVGADFKVTPIDTIGLSYSQARIKYQSVETLTPVVETTESKDRAQGISLYYAHDLSKRTNLYAGLGYFKTKSAANYTLVNTGTTITAVNVPSYTSSKAFTYNVGLEHKF